MIVTSYTEYINAALFDDLEWSDEWTVPELGKTELQELTGCDPNEQLAGG